jgi:hypothetical protein
MQKWVLLIFKGWCPFKFDEQKYLRQNNEERAID